MSTALPIDMWEKIVEQLPPPPPKLVHCIAVFKYKSDDEWVSVYVSKAVSEVELKTIMQYMKCYESLTGEYKFTVRFHNVDEIVNTAFMYGWDFSSDFDRQSYESHGRTFRLIKKSI